MGGILNECTPGKKELYSVVSEIIRHPDSGEYRTYGISVITPGRANVLRDISPCEETVQRMVEHFNRCELSPLHLNDAVSDMLP